MAPAPLQSVLLAQLLESRSLFGCEDALDFHVRGVDLAPHVRPALTLDRFDFLMMLLEDALNRCALRGRQLKLAVESADNMLGEVRRTPRRELMRAKEIEAIAGDARENPGHERSHDDQNSRRSGATRH